MIFLILYSQKIYEFSSCGEEDSCAQMIFDSYPTITYRNRTNITTGFYNQGYNIFNLTTPILVRKGSIIGILHKNLTLALHTDNAMFSDYYFSGSSLFKINKLNNYRFLLNALIDQTYYFGYTTNTLTYSNLKNENFGVYNMSAQFDGNGRIWNRFYNVTNCNLS